MVQIIINLIAIGFGCFFFFSGRIKYMVIVILYFLLSNGFGLYNLLPSESSIKQYDFALLFMFMLIVLRKKPFNIKGDKYAKYIFFFTGIHLLLFFLTIINRYETFSFAFKDIRAIFLYLLYFPLKKLNNLEIKRAFKFIFYIEVFLAINFFLQYFGIYLLKTYKEIEFDGGIERYRNVPAWFNFYFIYLVTTSEKIKNKPLWIFVFLALLILPMARMRILLTAIALAWYFIFISNDLKRVVRIVLPIGIAVILFLPFLMSRFEDDDKGVDFKQDITYAFTMDSKSYDPKESGTFGFRIAMLMERIDYLVNNPTYSITGLGFRHEESPNCYRNFNFHIGTYNEKMPNNIGELHSVDNNWVRIISQMGFIGVVAYLGLMLKLFSLLYAQKEDSLCVTGALLVLIYGLGSITEAVWTENYLFIVLISVLMSYNFRLELWKQQN